LNCGFACSPGKPRGYAKKAQKQLPSLEDYEAAKQQVDESGKILVLEHEAERLSVAGSTA